MTLAGIAFVVLYVILGVTLWVSFVATGGAALIGLSAGLTIVPGPDRDTARNGARTNLTVDVAALRIRFLFALALVALGGFLAGEVFAFSPAAATGIGLALGIAAVSLTLALSPVLVRVRTNQADAPGSGMRRAIAWGAFAAVTAVVGVWQIVQTQVFTGDTVKWLSFADGFAMLGVGLVALVVHELSTERVVHAIEVIDTTAGKDRQAARRSASDLRVPVA